MSRIYGRSQKLNEQIYEVKLRIPEWKVLFALDGSMDEGALAEFLEMEVTEVRAVLDRLKEKQLIEEVSAEEAAAASEAEAAPEAVDRASREAAPSEPEAASDSGPEDRLIEFDEAEETPELEEPASVNGSPAEEEATEEAQGSDEEFDRLIGELFEEEPAANEEPLSGGAKSAQSPAPEEETHVATEDELDLEGMFEEELTETEESLTEVMEEMEEEATAEEGVPEVVEEKEPLPKKTIMVVDDSVVIRKMVEIALENEEHFEIVTIGNGKEALKYLDEQLPDLILLDIMLPDVNGLDVLKAIKASDRSKNIPVLMLSAKDTPRETTHAKELGANGFISKPFKDEELIAKIKELVEG